MANHNSHSHSSLFLAVSISLLAVVNARPTNSNGSSRHAALAANSLGDGPNARHRVVESLGERRKKALEGSFDVPSRLDWHDAGLLRRVKRDGGAAKKDVKKKGILKRLWARVRKLFNVKKHYLHVKQSLKRRFNKRKTEMKEIEKKLEESKGGSKTAHDEAKKELEELRKEFNAIKEDSKKAQEKVAEAEGKIDAVKVTISEMKEAHDKTAATVTSIDGKVEKMAAKPVTYAGPIPTTPFSFTPQFKFV